MLASHRQDQGPDTPAETIERFWHRGVSVSYILSLLPRCIEASFLKEVAGKLQMGNTTAINGDWDEARIRVWDDVTAFLLLTRRNESCR